MDGVIVSIFLTLLTVEFIMGNLGNGFIALVNCMDWVKTRKISAVDHIITMLAISRIVPLWIIFLYWWGSVICPTLLKTGKMFRMITVSWIVTNHFSIWLGTSLSIFYFLKIANFSNSIFLYFKWRVKKIFPVICSVCLALLFLCIILLNMNVGVLTEGSDRNVSYLSSARNSTEFSNFVLYVDTIVTFIPFTVSLITFLLLIISLWKHLKKMRLNGTGSRDASTEAHIKALQIMIASVLLYTFYFLSRLIQVWSLVFLEGNPSTIFFIATELAFPTAHTFVLILGNEKLRWASHLVLGWLRCSCRDLDADADADDIF